VCGGIQNTSTAIDCPAFNLPLYILLSYIKYKVKIYQYAQHDWSLISHPRRHECQRGSVTFEPERQCTDATIAQDTLKKRFEEGIFETQFGRVFVSPTSHSLFSSRLMLLDESSTQVGRSRSIRSEHRRRWDQRRSSYRVSEARFD
jgi:hypothetical protein